uniref:Uncharacterized protein n=1 Tax=viral metagenome TaxID=1070528 RepID=A0A6H1ZHC5_9ZZZZ
MNTTVTEFQQRIVSVLPKFPNGIAGTWEIAQKTFPEKWAKRSGRGALIAHIRRAGYELERTGDICCVLPAQDQFSAAKLRANR